MSIIFEKKFFIQIVIVLLTYQITIKQKNMQLLKKHNACEDAQQWAQDKTIEEAYNTCPRGDWMLWLFAKTNPDDLQRLTLAKGHCANTVRHLMKDERSIKAVDVAIAFGEGKATREELNAAAADAAAYYAAADARKEMTIKILRYGFSLFVMNVN